MVYPEVVDPHNRYVILDENGLMLNRIATDSDIIAYAGYGAYLAYEGEGDNPQIDTQAPWIYLGVKPDMSMCQGDIMDIHTGHVTRPVPPPEPPVEEIVE